MKPTSGEPDLTAADTIATGETDRSRSRPRDLGESYTLGDVLGRGGMGEVVLGKDRELERDVAIKRLATANPTEDAVVRFLREARIQARLDHPAIVPVHELGYDTQGQPYFTMKRLVGVTLAELLATRRESLVRLLRAFVDVALAVEFAHSRGIVHRDLKPANIMLGDFGEVYILDWGLAKVMNEVDDHAPTGESTDSLAGVTAVGALLGTPGYMSPEQISDASHVDAATDRYALGAILFELLAGEPLHDRTNAIASTLGETETSPQRRTVREIAPELDALCVAATAILPSVRPTARVLADGVQSYLDGDRDLARRRELASSDVALAREHLDAGRHAEAMRAAGRALALDPTSAGAAIVSRLMLEPPASIPPDLHDQIRAEDSRLTATRARIALRAYLVFFAAVPLLIWNGIESWRLLITIVVLVGVLMVAAGTLARDPNRGRREMWLYAVGNAALVALTARLFGPFILAPAITCVAVASLASYPGFVKHGWLVGASCLLAWMIPIVMEITGVLRPSWSLENGILLIQSYSLELEGTMSSVVLFLVTFGTMVVAVVHTSSLAKTNHAARHELIRQRWQLGQLLPERSLG